MRPSRTILAVALTGALAACGSTPAATEQPPASPAVAAIVPTAEPSPALVEPPPPVVPERGVFVAVPETKWLRLWSNPGPRPVREGRLGTRNDWGQTVPMLVEGGFRDRNGREWLRVSLPVRPNGSTGWIDAAHTHLERRHERIVVDLSERSLWHYRDGDLRHDLTVGVGMTDFPTTPGRFSVWARVFYDDPTGTYGPFALGLTGFSDVITDWPGGGRMAIHGTSDPNDKGAAVSYGCVRVYNPELGVLRDVPLGTPVVIRP